MLADMETVAASTSDPGRDLPYVRYPCASSQAYDSVTETLVQPGAGKGPRTGIEQSPPHTYRKEPGQKSENMVGLAER